MKTQGICKTCGKKLYLANYSFKWKHFNILLDDDHEPDRKIPKK